MLIGSTCENEEHKLYKHGESVSGMVLVQTRAGSRLVSNPFSWQVGNLAMLRLARLFSISLIKTTMSMFTVKLPVADNPHG